jgi:gamma-glutamyl-gamma-aminobutyrate hydrolase PuuD
MNSIVEGFEDLENQIWAVQWHPEKMESENNEYPLDKLF